VCYKSRILNNVRAPIVFWLRKIKERQLIVELLIPTESGAQLDILLIICNLFLASALPLFVLDIFLPFRSYPFKYSTGWVDWYSRHTKHSKFKRLIDLEWRAYSFCLDGLNYSFRLYSFMECATRTYVVKSYNGQALLDKLLSLWWTVENLLRFWFHLCTGKNQYSEKNKVGLWRSFGEGKWLRKNQLLWELLNINKDIGFAEVNSNFSKQIVCLFCLLVCSCRASWLLEDVSWSTYFCFCCRFCEESTHYIYNSKWNQLNRRNFLSICVTLRT